MVRAVNLETSASGSYTNASQGVFAAASVTEGPLPTPVFSSLFLRDAQFHAKVLANAGLHYELQATTNFVDWEVVARLVATASPFELVDTNATNFNERYYRVSTGP